MSQFLASATPKLPPPIWTLMYVLVATVISYRKRKIPLSLTHSYCVRSCAASVGRRREDRQICVAARQRMEADLTIPDGCKLAAQKAWRGSVFRGRPDGVYDSDASSRLECRSEVI